MAPQLAKRPRQSAERTSVLFLVVGCDAQCARTAPLEGVDVLVVGGL